MVDGRLEPAARLRQHWRLSPAWGSSGVWSRIAGSFILLAFGAVAMQVLLGREVTNPNASDVVTAAATVGLGFGGLVNRRVAIPAALWAGGAAILGAIQLISPDEPRIGEVTFYLGYGLTGRHWDAAGGYLLTALGYGAAALLLLWSTADPRDPDAPTARLLSRTAGLLLVLTAVFHGPSALLLGMVVLGSPFGSDAFDATAVWLGGIGSVVVALWARHGQRRGAVAGWAALMFAASSLSITGGTGTDPLPGARFLTALPQGLLVPIQFVAHTAPGGSLAVQWLVAASWLSVCLLVIADRIAATPSADRSRRDPAAVIGRGG